MAQYIPVCLDDEERNYHNKGLYDIIAFIGQQNTDKIDLSEAEAYRRGKKIVNTALKKWHSTAIEHLVTAKKTKHSYNGRTPEVKPFWKIHRTKAKRIFGQIYQIINKYNSEDISALFDAVCQKYGFQTGDNAVGTPYYRIIKDRNQRAELNYDEKDDKVLENCANTIYKFSKYR